MRTLRAGCALSLFILLLAVGRPATAGDTDPGVSAPRHTARATRVAPPADRAVYLARLTALDDARAFALGNQPRPPAPPAWFCPVQGMAEFVDSWGDRRSGGRRHEGVDMMSPAGTPVVAPVAGTVELRGDRLGGLSFHLDGVDGNYYFGTHLSDYGTGGWVEAGTVVGYVGSSGNASTPHLHFEIHPGGRGTPINPYPTVAAWC